jgi:hypothetical protein
MATIADDGGTNSAHRESPYSGLPNKLVRAADGIDYAYRDTVHGCRASGLRPQARKDRWGMTRVRGSSRWLRTARSSASSSP